MSLTTKYIYRLSEKMACSLDTCGQDDGYYDYEGRECQENGCVTKTHLSTYGTSCSPIGAPVYLEFMSDFALSLGASKGKYAQHLGEEMIMEMTPDLCACHTAESIITPFFFVFFVSL